jgi:hypothetical protein
LVNQYLIFVIYWTEFTGFLGFSFALPASPDLRDRLLKLAESNQPATEEVKTKETRIYFLFTR